MHLLAPPLLLVSTAVLGLHHTGTCCSPPALQAYAPAGISFDLLATVPGSLGDKAAYTIGNLTRMCSALQADFLDAALKKGDNSIKVILVDSIDTGPGSGITTCAWFNRHLGLWTLLCSISCAGPLLKQPFPFQTTLQWLRALWHLQCRGDEHCEFSQSDIYRRQYFV